jgi:hypothetical protein
MIIFIVWAVVAILCFPGGEMKTAIAYEGVENFQGATIEGKIIFKGKVPPLEKREVRRDVSFCGEFMTMTPMIVNARSHGVSQVVVSLDEVSRGKPLQPTNGVPLLNAKCRFEPHTQVAVLNSPLEISSVDPVLHNTHLRLQGKTFLNIALPPQGRIIRKVLTKPGLLHVQCDAHKFMDSTIHVFSHPYFTLTDVNGDFVLSGVPAGDYQLTLWQEAIGMVQQPIQIPASGTLNVTVDLNTP